MIKTFISDSPYNDSKQSCLDVEIKGLSTMTEKENGRVVWVEFYDGKWWLRVWADINQEDPTHSIDLSGAMITARDEDWPDE